jgi:hypothetical protein
VSIALGQKVAQASGAIRLGVVSEDVDEVGHIELIRPKSPLGCPAVSPHPPKECSNDRGWLRSCLCRCEATALAKMAHRDSNARDKMTVLRCPRTSAVRAMPIERHYGPVVDLPDVKAFALKPDSKVHSATEMQPNDTDLVAGLQELDFVVTEQRAIIWEVPPGALRSG